MTFGPEYFGVRVFLGLALTLYQCPAVGVAASRRRRQWSKCGRLTRRRRADRIGKSAGHKRVAESPAPSNSGSPAGGRASKIRDQSGGSIQRESGS
jgi:hypothetical protein